MRNKVGIKALSKYDSRVSTETLRTKLTKGLITGLIAAAILCMLFGVSLISGCEYQTKTERRIALFYKSENNGDVGKSRDIGSFTHKRNWNATSKWLDKNLNTSPRNK